MYGDLPYVQKALARHIRDHSSVEIEYRIRKADRSISWILSKGHVYYGSDQVPERMIGVRYRHHRTKNAVRRT